MKKMLFVFNPHSGKGLLKKYLYEVVDEFTSNDYMVTVYPTKAAMDGYQYIVDNGSMFDIIACAGGDGTFNEVVRGVRDAGIDVPIGYIPAGSTNDFGNSVGISKAIHTAASQMMDGNPALCDMGRFNDKFFNYVAAFGAFTDVSYITSQKLKNVIGHSAYIVEAVKDLMALKAYDITITLDNGEVIRDDFIYGMISNSRYVAGMKGLMGNHVAMNDGLLELTFIKYPKNPIQFEQLVSGLLLRDIILKKDICISRKVRSVKVSCDSQVPWTTDGEYGGSVKKADIEVIPDAFRLVITKKI